MRYAIHNLLRSSVVLLMIGIVLLGCEEAVLTPTEAPEQHEQSEAVLTEAVQAANDAARKNNASLSFTSVEVFQPAGPAGERGVLTEGDMFAPTKRTVGTMLRGKDFIQVNVHTNGLPQGAYTTWWALINEPSECAPTPLPDIFPDVAGDCGFDELFDVDFDTGDVGPSVPSVFWSTGKLVQHNGVGNFSDRTSVGDPFGDPFPRQHLWGPGLTNPQEVVVLYIIKYHGPASDDPDELHEQTHTLLGLCDDRANAYPLPDGNCFDPQIAVFAP